MATGGMYRKEKDEVTFYQFPVFSGFENLRHAVFTREGGHSTGPFHSLNASLGVGDDPDSVRKNRWVMSKCLRVEADALVFARQNHGSHVLTDIAMDMEWDSAGFRVVGTGDAMVTDTKGKYLTVQVADCQSVILYDAIREVVANVHSGWRGSIANIIGRTIDVMVQKLNCAPQDIAAGVSPSLGPCCAEFIHYRTEIPKKLWRYKDARHHFDFWTLSYDQLREKGVLSENISISSVCTKCHQNLFFSYRGKRLTGRFATVIGMTV